MTLLASLPSMGKLVLLADIDACSCIRVFSTARSLANKPNALK
jgi:hypothetical protein